MILSLVKHQLYYIADNNAGGFTEDEIQNLKDIFDLFDKDRSGRIEIKDLEAIMNSLQRDPNEAKDLLR